MTPAAPCCRCGSPGGEYHANTHRPARISLARFGLVGSSCSACYSTIAKRAARGADPATGLPRKRPARRPA